MSRYGSRGSGAPLDCKVYVGDLGNRTSKEELEAAFGYYGPLRNVWVARNPPGFAFVEFEDSRDAEDSVRGLDGRNIGGNRVRVELSTGKTRRSRPPPRGGRRFDPNDRCYECGRPGHYAYDCARRIGSSRRRSRSTSRGRRRSRSHSRDRRSRSRSYDRKHSASRSRSMSPRQRSGSRGRSPMNGESNRRSGSRN